MQICRGNKGAVIVNTEGKLSADFETQLADGTYIDRIDNKTEYTVKNGRLTCESPIKAHSVVVLYNDGYTEYPPSASVSVSEDVNFIFDKKEVSVTLESKNTDKAFYSINDGEEIPFENGDSVKLNSSDLHENVITLTLKGTGKSGQNTYMKYYFTKPGNTILTVIIISAVALSAVIIIVTGIYLLKKRK